MKFSLADATSGFIIHAYREGEITIDELTYTSSLILLPDQLISDWPVTHVDQLTEQHFTQLLETQPDLVVLGTGATQRFPSQKLSRPLIDGGIGLEVMTTSAACRTYNILASEGRRVAAALLLEN